MRGYADVEFPPAGEPPASAAHHRPKSSPRSPSLAASPPSHVLRRKYVEHRDDLQKNYPRLLLVEDDESNAMIFEIVLSEEFEVSVASNCAEAMALCRELHFDVFVLDLQLPDGNGAQLLAHLRSTRTHTQTPAMAMSAAAYRRRGATMAPPPGFQVALLKPPPTLNLVVRYALELCKRRPRVATPLLGAPEPSGFDLVSPR